MNAQLTKNYNAGAAVTARRIVKFDGSGNIIQAVAATDSILGVSTDIDSLSGESCDVIHSGIVMVKAGGAINPGALVTADASGQAVAAAPATGVNNRILGMYLGATAAASGDLIDVLIDLGSLQG